MRALAERGAAPEVDNDTPIFTIDRRPGAKSVITMHNEAAVLAAFGTCDADELLKRFDQRKAG